MFCHTSRKLEIKYDCAVIFEIIYRYIEPIYYILYAEYFNKKSNLCECVENNRNNDTWDFNVNYLLKRMIG